MNVSEHNVNAYNAEDFNKAMYYPAGCSSCSCCSAASTEEE